MRQDDEIRQLTRLCVQGGEGSSLVELVVLVAELFSTHTHTKWLYFSFTTLEMFVFSFLKVWVKPVLNKAHSLLGKYLQGLHQDFAKSFLGQST